MQLNTTEKIKNELRQLDTQLAVLINKYGDIEIQLADNYFESLASSIVGQQLSNKVADVIWTRLVKFLGSEVDGIPNTVKSLSNYKQCDGCQITPEAIVAASVENLRSVGLSTNKATYLKNLSQAVIDGSLNLCNIQEISNDEIIMQLIKIKGIGRWTAEMFLIFSLGRQDIFSMGDGGLYNAIRKLYSLENPTKAQIQEITQKWSPYRSYASLYLWKSLDNE